MTPDTERMYIFSVLKVKIAISGDILLFITFLRGNVFPNYKHPEATALSKSFRLPGSLTKFCIKCKSKWNQSQ